MITYHLMIIGINKTSTISKMREHTSGVRVLGHDPRNDKKCGAIAFDSSLSYHMQWKGCPLRGSWTQLFNVEEARSFFAPDNDDDDDDTLTSGHVSARLMYDRRNDYLHT